VSACRAWFASPGYNAIMTSLCVWPLVFVSLLLFCKGVLPLLRGRLRGFRSPVTQETSWVMGGPARVIGFFLMLPFLVGAGNAVVDAVGLWKNDPDWGLYSSIVGFVHLGMLLVCLTVAGIIYLFSPETNAS
jgi:hypothetical protein